jgi:hypothetical protein
VYTQAPRLLPELDTLTRAVEKFQKFEQKAIERGEELKQPSALRPLGVGGSYSEQGTLAEGQALLREIREKSIIHRKWWPIRKGLKEWQDIDPMPLEKMVLGLEAELRAIARLASCGCRLARDGGDTDLAQAMFEMEDSAAKTMEIVSTLRRRIVESGVNYLSRKGPAAYLVAPLQDLRDFEFDGSTTRDERLLKLTVYPKFREWLSRAADHVKGAAESGGEIERVEELSADLRRNEATLAAEQAAAAAAYLGQVDGIDVL